MNKVRNHPGPTPAWSSLLAAPLVVAVQAQRGLFYRVALLALRAQDVPAVLKKVKSVSCNEVHSTCHMSVVESTIIMK